MHSAGGESPRTQVEEVETCRRHWYDVYRPLVQDTLEDALCMMDSAPGANCGSRDFQFSVETPCRLKLFKAVHDDLSYLLKTCIHEVHNVNSDSESTTVRIPGTFLLITIFRSVCTMLPPAFEALAPRFTDWIEVRRAFAVKLWEDAHRLLADAVWSRPELAHNVEIYADSLSDVDLQRQPITTAMADEIFRTLMGPATTTVADFCSQHNSLFVSQPNGGAPAATKEIRTMLEEYFRSHLMLQLMRWVKAIAMYQSRSLAQDVDNNNGQGKKRETSDLTQGSLEVDEADLEVNKPPHPKKSRRLQVEQLWEIFGIPLLKTPHQMSKCAKGRNELWQWLFKRRTIELVQLRRVSLPLWSLPHYSDLNNVGDVLAEAVRLKILGTDIKLLKNGKSPFSRFEVFGKGGELVRRLNRFGYTRPMADLDNYPPATVNASQIFTVVRGPLSSNHKRSTRRKPLKKKEEADDWADDESFWQRVAIRLEESPDHSAHVSCCLVSKMRRDLGWTGIDRLNLERRRLFTMRDIEQERALLRDKPKSQIGAYLR